jgi:hypothetical protein
MKKNYIYSENFKMYNIEELTGPLIVPVPHKSPGRVLQPFNV